jgi:hypothetical protein
MEMFGLTVAGHNAASKRIDGCQGGRFADQREQPVVIADAL